MNCNCDKVTPSQVLLPVLLLSLTFAVFQGFQTKMLVSDKDSLNQAYTQQDKQLEQVEKVKTQVNALAKGTLTLSEQGNKNAQAIIDMLKKAGVNVQEQPQAGTLGQQPTVHPHQ